MQVEDINLKDLVDNAAEKAVVILSIKTSIDEEQVAACTKGTLTDVCTLIGSLITSMAKQFIDKSKSDKPLRDVEGAIVHKILKCMDEISVGNSTEIPQ